MLHVFIRGLYNSINIADPPYIMLHCADSVTWQHFSSHENPQHVTGPFGRNPTPLVAALHCGHLDIAELLYQAGADLNIRNDDNMTLLHAASDRGLVDVAKWLFKHCVPTNSQRDEYETPLHLTEANSHPGHVISIDEVDDNFNTPLHLASQGGHFEIVRELLRRGADVTAQNWKHMTPLHLASNYSASPKLRLS
jgi:ankyrin repeat protein